MVQVYEGYLCGGTCVSTAGLLEDMGASRLYNAWAMVWTLAWMVHASTASVMQLPSVGDTAISRYS